VATIRRIATVASTAIPWFNVKAYGAEGNGIADDTTAVQNTITAAAAAAGLVYIPTGTYRITSRLTLPSNTTLAGEGWNSILRFTWTTTAGGSTYLVNSNAGNTTGNSNIHLRDLSIEGAHDGTPFGQQSPGPAAGLLVRRVDNFTCIGVRFYRIPGIALAYQGTRRGIIANNLVHEGGRDGITGGPYVEWPLEDVVIDGNVICGVGDDAIAVHAYADTATPNTQGRPRRITVTGNTVYGMAAYPGTSATVSMTNGSAVVTGTGFSATDLSKIMAVPGAGASGATLTGKITTFTSSTSVTLDTTASTTVSSVTATYSHGAGRGIYLHGIEDSTCTGNVVDSTFSHGISLSADTTSGNGPGGVGGWRNVNVSVADNVVRRGGAMGDNTQPRWGIRVTGNDYCTVAGNHVADSGSIGIYCTDLLGCHIDRNTVTGSGSVITSYGIDLDGVSTTKTIVACTANGNLCSGNYGGGIRALYVNYTEVSDNMCFNNGAAGAGSDANGSGILIRTDGSALVANNRCADTRGSGSKTQTHGIHLGIGGDLTLIGNDLLSNNGSGIDIATSPTILVKRGNKESGTTRNNYDQDYSGTQHRSGGASPEGVVTAPVGSTFHRTDGGSATCLYVKESGTGNTGWVAK
jgi:parallel beta-helix repeat protein